MQLMPVNDEQRPLADESEHCRVCRHCVDVRGMEHIVCLAYLAVRQPLTDGSCVEFERNRRRASVLAKL